MAAANPSATTIQQRRCLHMMDLANSSVGIVHGPWLPADDRTRGQVRRLRCDVDREPGTADHAGPWNDIVLAAGVGTV